MLVDLHSPAGQSTARPTTLAARPSVLPLALIGLCVLAELALIRVGIDDLDEGYFAQQAQRVVHGQVPFRDFQSLYTPGLAFAHAWLFGLLGAPSLVALRALSLAARAGLAVMLYALARPLVRQPLWAAAPGVFLLVLLDDAPVRWEPQPGWPSTLFAVLAVWTLSHPPARHWLIASGASAAAAYAFKQNTGLVVLVAITLRPILVGGRRGTRPFSRLARPHYGQFLWPLAAFGGVTAVWVGPLALALAGDARPLGVFLGAVNQAGLLSAPDATSLIPVACLAGGLCLARCDRDPRLRWLLLAGVSLVLTQYPRMDSLHLAWSAPLLLVVGAVALDRLRPALATAALALAILLVAPTFIARLSYALGPRAPVADVEAPPQTAADLNDVVADIRGRTSTDQPIFVYPTSPLLYVLADRPNPTRFDHLNPGAATPAQVQAVIADLTAAHLQVAIISEFWRLGWGPPGSNAPLEQWLDVHFSEVVRYGAYRVLVARL